MRSQKALESMPRQLANETWTNTVLNRQIYPSALLRKLAQPGKVLDQDIRQAYSNEYGVRAKVLAIVTDTQQRAFKVWQLASRNPIAEHFGNLSKQYSTEPTIRKNRGEVPPIQKHSEHPELEKVAFDLQHGQISDIVESGGKFIILFSLGLEHPKNYPALEEVRGDLTELVKEKKIRQAMEQKFAELKSVANIVREPFSVKMLLDAPRLVSTGSTPTKTNPAPNALKSDFKQPTTAMPADNGTSKMHPGLIKKQVTKSVGDTVEQEKLVTKTYAIADLIVPISVNNQMELVDKQWSPMTLTSGQNNPLFATQKHLFTDADAKPLTELIQSTIAPDSWANAKLADLERCSFSKNNLV